MQVLHVKEKLQRHGFLGRIRGPNSKVNKYTIRVLECVERDMQHHECLERLCKSIIMKGRFLLVTVW